MSIGDLAILFGCDTVVSQGGERLGETAGTRWEAHPFFQPCQGCATVVSGGCGPAVRASARGAQSPYGGGLQANKKVVEAR